MKHFCSFIFLVLLFLGISLNAQNNNPSQRLKNRDSKYSQHENIAKHRLDSLNNAPSFRHKTEPDWFDPAACRTNAREFNTFGSVIFKPEIITTKDLITPDERISYTYDASGNKLTELDEKWENNAWVNYYRYAYSYDTNGNRLTELDEQWENNAWVNYERSTYSYDTNGKMLTSLYERWQDNAWLNYRRYTYSYDANGNRLTELYEQWENNAWVNSERYTYSYDANGNRLTTLDERWENNAWVNSHRSTNTYDANRNWLTSLYEQWQNNAWVNSERYTYSYDASGNELTGLDERWQNNAWLNYRRYTNTYDASGNELAELYERWRNNAWENSERYIYTYDINGNATEGIYEVCGNQIWSPANGSLGMCFNHRTEYYHGYCYKISIQYTAVTDVKDESPSVFSYSLEQNYPNPFNPETQINYNLAEGGNVRLSIYDITGRRVAALVNSRQEAGMHRVKLRADKYGLASGIYFYELRANDFRTVKKLLLMK